MANAGRDIVGLTCEACKRQNYVTTRNKVNMAVANAKKPKLVISKFCRHCRKHTLHKEKAKLK